MSERFTKLYELQKNLYSEGSPIIVSAGSLLKDTQTSNIIVQLKFHSVSATTIKALKVSISAFDIAGKEIDGISEYQYLDLNIQNGQEFGSNKAIVMPDPVTRSFAINSITVVLTDGHIQNVSMPLSSLPQPVAIQSVLKDVELVKQYKLKTNDSATYIPQESHGLWQCHCGEWNSCSVCSRCKGRKSITFAALDLTRLTNEMHARLADEAQKKAEAERRAEIEKQEKEKQLATEEAHRKAVNMKAKKILSFVIPVLTLAIVLAIWVYPDVIKPNMMYKDAVKLLSSGQYDAAVDVFLSLGSYKDSSIMANEAKYQKAEKLLEEKEYEEAISAFSALGDYRDASIRVSDANTALLNEMYEDAEELLEAGEWDAAISAFAELGSHRDSALRAEEARVAELDEKYIHAENLLINGQYENAIVAFEQIVTHRDAAAKKAEAERLFNEEKYNYADNLLKEGDLAAAAIEFGKLIGFADAEERSYAIWQNIISNITLASSNSASAALLADGSVVVTPYTGRLNKNIHKEMSQTSSWTDIVSISVGSLHTLGLKTNGTVLAAGYNLYDECIVNNWNNVVQIAAGDGVSVGLRADGTVLIASDNYSYDDVPKWENIRSIYSGEEKIIGIKTDGTVVIDGHEDDCSCCAVSSWTNIAAIAANYKLTAGLKSDGTVVTTSATSSELVSTWHDIVSIGVCGDTVIGLMADGSIVVASDESDSLLYEAEKWENIVAISTGYWHIIGLTKDGSLIVSPFDNDDPNTFYDGQCEVSDWTNIRIPD